MKKLLAITLFILTSSAVYATGPSWINSKIVPFSINDKGDILCRTRYEENRIGAHYPMVVTYGYCIIKEGRIIELPVYQELNPIMYDNRNFDELYAERYRLDSVFTNCADTTYLESIKTYVNAALHELDFKQCNVNKYKVDKILSKEQFEKNKKIGIAETPQKALKEAQGNDYLDDDVKIHVLYDFGDVIIVENKGNDERISGSEFDYYNPWKEEGVKINIGFDYFDITGVFFIK